MSSGEFWKFFCNVIRIALTCTSITNDRSKCDPPVCEKPQWREGVMTCVPCTITPFTLYGCFSVTLFIDPLCLNAYTSTDNGGMAGRFVQLCFCTVCGRSSPSWQNHDKKTSMLIWSTNIWNNPKNVPWRMLHFMLHHVLKDLLFTSGKRLRAKMYHSTQKWGHAIP